MKEARADKRPNYHNRRDPSHKGGDDLGRVILPLSLSFFLPLSNYGWPNAVRKEMPRKCGLPNELEDLIRAFPTGRSKTRRPWLAGRERLTQEVAECHIVRQFDLLSQHHEALVGDVGSQPFDERPREADTGASCGEPELDLWDQSSQGRLLTRFPSTVV